MKRIVMLMAATAALLLVVSCQQAAPTPTSTPAKAAAPTAAPTKAAATLAPTSAPTKAPAPTIAATTAPTKAPAPAAKVGFPEKGRNITYVVTWPAGGGVDTSARLLAPFLEKELGVPVQVVSKPGASGQVGWSEFVKSKPDGYTIASVDIPTCGITYLLPDRGATYTRKDFIPFGMYYKTNAIVAVKLDSPYKTAKDLVDAARAKPTAIRIGDTGLLGPYHLAVLAMEKETGARFTHVHFDGGPPLTTALLGDHVDVGLYGIPGVASAYKSGQVRLLGVFSKERDPLVPEVPTFPEQGVNFTYAIWYVLSVPAGTPTEIAQILERAMRNAMSNEEFRKKAPEAMLTLVPPMSGSQIDAMWMEADSLTKELLQMAKETK